MESTFYFCQNGLCYIVGLGVKNTHAMVFSVSASSHGLALCSESCEHFLNWEISSRKQLNVEAVRQHRWCEAHCTKMNFVKHFQILEVGRLFKDVWQTLRFYAQAMKYS